MKHRDHKIVRNIPGLLLLIIIWAGTACESPQRQEQKETQVLKQERHTEVTIVGEQFHINGSPVYDGRTWATSYGGEYPIEGLLMNARLVQGVFDDLNQVTRGQWAYPDTKEWDPNRNTQDFVNAMASWREHGLLAFTLNLQGGCPYGYCRSFPWVNDSFYPDGKLREGFMNRVERIIERADELGMVVILGYFYFGEDGNLEDEQAIIRAVENTTNWVLDKGYTNVIVEINNECDNRYDHEILKCERVHELIELVQNIERDGRSLYVSTSLGGGRVPPPRIIEVSDYVLLHGNGVRDPARIVEMSREVREMDVYTPKPLVNNEDDQPWRVDEQGWGEEGNNFVASVKNYTSWGYFDFRLEQEHHDYNQGFQSIPVNWHITSERKRDFFDLLAEITGNPGTPKIEIKWPDEPGRGIVRIENDRTDIQIDQVELLMNNRVISTLRKEEFDFTLDRFGQSVPAGEHWLRVRATYHSGDREVIIESPHYRNPWWPYGGRF